MAAAIAAAVIAAVARIRRRRALRYALIAAAIAGGAAYSLAFATGVADVDVVERVHFVEYGAITWLFYRAARRVDDVSALALPVMGGAFVATMDEWFQWFVPVRVGEARDVLLDLIAVGCGLLFSVAIDPPAMGRIASPRSQRRMALAAAVVIAAFAAFVDTVHLGYRVTAGDLSFASRYSLAQLETLARDRGEAWRTDPPVVLRRVSREDHYLDEGLWHVRRRNEAWTAGDVRQAWGENRILETFFTPVLDTPTYAGMAGHRWTADQRAEAKRRRPPAAVAETFVSSAAPYPILFWPHAWFRAAAAALICAAIVAARIRPLAGR